MRTSRVLRRGARRAGLAALVVPVALAGCAASAPGPGVSQPPLDPSAPSASASPTPSVSDPADGVSLRSLGLTNGPVDRVFVPTSSAITARVDQPGNVTLVLTAPSAPDLFTFYRRSTVANGFTVEAMNAEEATLIFTGFGWRGTFTGDAEASALLLRPAP